MPAVVASVQSQTTTEGTTRFLSIQGDSAQDKIVVRESNGRLSIDGINIRVGAATQRSIGVGFVSFISVMGGPGNDRIDLSRVNGTTPKSGFYGIVSGGNAMVRCLGNLSRRGTSREDALMMH